MDNMVSVLYPYYAKNGSQSQFQEFYNTEKLTRGNDNMADNMGKFWSVSDLMQRYNINRASLIEYAKSKENIVNANAANMQKTGKEWKFNSEAVRILDELRGYGIVAENYDSPEKAKIAELEKELEEARKFMAAAQAENSRQKDKIIKLLEEKALLIEENKENLLLLTNAQSNLAVEQKTRELEKEMANFEKEKQQAEIETLKAEHATEKAEIEELKRKLQEAESALTTEKNKSFWKKLFGY